MQIAEVDDTTVERCISLLIGGERGQWELLTKNPEDKFKFSNLWGVQRIL